MVSVQRPDMEIFNHSHVSGAIETLIDEAATKLLLVSPYFDPSTRMSDAIRRAKLRGADVKLLLRGGKGRRKREQKATDLIARGCEVRFLGRLHAKLYVSENAAILTSMNLLESSARDSYEAGALFRNLDHPKEYSQVRQQAELLFNLADQQAAVEEVRSPAGRALRTPAIKSRTHASAASVVMSPVKGHCLRCAASIGREVAKPLCPICYKSWTEYEDPDHREKYCHYCGKKSASSFAKPLCKDCYRATS